MFGRHMLDIGRQIAIRFATLFRAKGALLGEMSLENVRCGCCGRGFSSSLCRRDGDGSKKRFAFRRRNRRLFFFRLLRRDHLRHTSLGWRHPIRDPSSTEYSDLAKMADNTASEHGLPKSGQIRCELYLKCKTDFENKPGNYKECRGCYKLFCLAHKFSSFDNCEKCVNKLKHSVREPKPKSYYY